MLARGVFAVLAALMVAGCSGGNEQPSGCGGAAVIITATLSPATVSDGGPDAGAGADAAADGGSGDAKPACTGSCLEYLEALRVAVEAATPATCERLTSGITSRMSLACVPSSTSPGGCGRDIVDETRALQAQISAYLSVSWPEIDTPAALDTCPCHLN